MSRMTEPIPFIETPEEWGCHCRSHTAEMKGDRGDGHREVEVGVVTKEGNEHRKTFLLAPYDEEFEYENQSDVRGDILFWLDEVVRCE